MSLSFKKIQRKTKKVDENEKKGWILGIARMTCSRNLASFGFSAENLISASQVPHCIYKQEKHLCPKMGQKETGLKIITVPIQTQTRMYDSALHVFPDVKFGRDTINSKKSNKMTYLFQSHYSDHTQKIHIRQPSLQHKLKEWILYIAPTGAFAERWTQIGVKKQKAMQYTVSALLLPAVWSYSVCPAGSLHYRRQKEN